MSSAHEPTRYKRLQWSADKYAKKYDIPRIKAYKALDRILTTSFTEPTETLSSKQIRDLSLKKTKAMKKTDKQIRELRKRIRARM
jgi:hypothetical protein